jgi:hypothetical protein
MFESGWPINGLRHLPVKGTCGWYLWARDYSENPNFFQSHHAEHIVSARPEIASYLALPPGWGFIIAPGYEDVWRDESLLVE